MTVSIPPTGLDSDGLTLAEWIPSMVEYAEDYRGQLNIDARHLCSEFALTDQQRQDLEQLRSMADHLVHLTRRLIAS